MTAAACAKASYLQTAETLSVWFQSSRAMHGTCALRYLKILLYGFHIYNKEMHIYRIDVVTAVLLKITVLWDVTLCC
jgi:hypothetical protein